MDDQPFSRRPEIPSLLTVGRIAAELREPESRVAYILRTHRNILPSAFAGNLRLYSRDALARIRHELNAMEARRAERKAVGHASR